MASLKRCRQIVRRARREGREGKRSITTNKEACLLHNPDMHFMAGQYVVVETLYDGAGESAHYLWE